MDPQAFEQAKKRLMKKYALTADQAGNAIEIGLKKMASMLPQGGLNVSGLADISEMSEADALQFREQAMSVLQKVTAMKKRGGDGVERAPRRNKYI